MNAYEVCVYGVSMWTSMHVNVVSLTLDTPAGLGAFGLLYGAVVAMAQDVPELSLGEYTRAESPPRSTRLGESDARARSRGAIL